MDQEVDEMIDFVTSMFPSEIENRRERVLPSGHVFACVGMHEAEAESHLAALSLIGEQILADEK